MGRTLLFPLSHEEMEAGNSWETPQDLQGSWQLGGPALPTAPGVIFDLGFLGWISWCGCTKSHLGGMGTGNIRYGLGNTTLLLSPKQPTPRIQVSASEAKATQSRTKVLTIAVVGGETLGTFVCDALPVLASGMKKNPRSGRS